MDNNEPVLEDFLAQCPIVGISTQDASDMYDYCLGQCWLWRTGQPMNKRAIPSIMRRLKLAKNIWKRPTGSGKSMSEILANLKEEK